MSLTTIDATYGGETTNSYVSSIAEANEIASLLAYLPFVNFDAQAWIASSDLAKSVALIYATNGLDKQAFIGLRRSDIQRRQWPRIETKFRFWNHEDGRETIPDEIKWAQVAEAAMLIGSEPSNPRDKDIISESVSGHSVTYSQSSINKSSDNLGDAALKILQRAGLVSTGVGTVQIRRG